MDFKVHIDRKDIHAGKSNYIRKAITVGMNELGKEMVKHAKINIKHSTKGYKKYNHYGIRGKVESSYPESYPANQTGELVSSIYYKNAGQKQMVFGSTAPYGGSLEYGHRWGNTIIEPRPFISTTDDSFALHRRKQIIRRSTSKVWGTGGNK